MIREHDGARQEFPIHRWIKADKRRVFDRYDCLLPQQDLRIDDRKEELAEKKMLYELTCKAEGLIPQVYKIK